MGTEYYKRDCLKRKVSARRYSIIYRIRQHLKTNYLACGRYHVSPSPVLRTAPTQCVRKRRNIRHYSAIKEGYTPYWVGKLPAKLLKYA